MQRITLEPIFVIHQRPYSNSSLIIECFSMRYGRVALMARSARGPKSRFRGVLQLFVPMLASWAGRGELKTLTDLELHGAPYQLEGDALLCGFYLNELLMRLLHREDPYPKVFQDYQDLLHQFELGANIQANLRRFEKRLLNHLGYGLPLTTDAQSGLAIDPSRYYQYMPERGFLLCDSAQQGGQTYLGASLLALHRDDYSNPQTLQDAKRLMRIVLSRHLGGKPLKSRELMV